MIWYHNIFIYSHSHPSFQFITHLKLEHTRMLNEKARNLDCSAFHLRAVGGRSFHQTKNKYIHCVVLSGQCVYLSYSCDLCSCSDSGLHTVFHNKTAFYYSKILSAMLYDIIRARSAKGAPNI